ncbi:MAG TPA: hypothetical protein VJY40_09135, partial [Corynebacterium sp.]|nr:hypothetical protein [Corynebacterium sp.]
YGDVTRTLTRSGITYADLGLESEAALASLVEDLIEQASGIIDTYCERDFALHEAVTERLDGNGRERIRLAGHPLVSVTSVTLGSTPLDSTSYEVHPGAGILERIDGGVWSAGRRNLTIVYSYGYATTPPAIAGVVEDLVVGALTNAARNRAVKGASSMSMDGYSVAYSELSRLMGLAPEQVQILDRYRVAAG